MKGVLLLNLGTPDAPTTPDVRRYLREFLSDPFVIDIPPIARWLLVNGIIAPFRSPKSAKAYQQIWTDRGSPLLFHTRDLAEKVQKDLGHEYSVKMAMRYGKPSIAEALREFKLESVNEIVALPLYPQYALSSTESSIAEIRRQAALLKEAPRVRLLPPFYGDLGFIRAFSTIGKESLANFNADHVLFSFHGLPERHLTKLHPDFCLKADYACCSLLTAENRNCYRAQSVCTARLIAKELNLAPERMTISFQSRLGRTPWIRPFTDLVIPELAKKSVKRLAVFCPSFVADCLETLEEIQIRALELFKENGGEELRLIPSLNSRPEWVGAVSSMIRSA